MKKFLLPISVICCLTACSQERNQYQAELAKHFAKDKDILDYQIDPDDLADCVVGKISETVPAVAGSPVFENYFRGYQLLIPPEKPQDMPQQLKLAEEIFGSKKNLAKAQIQLSSNSVECITAVRQHNTRMDNLFTFDDDE